MLATPSTNKGSSTLFAFTPRQVLLNNQTMKHSVDNGTLNTKQEPKLLLHQSIAHYLQRSGFSKSLKKFCSEAKIEKDDFEGSLVDLEEMCLKYLEICGKDAKSNVNDQHEQGVHAQDKEEGKSREKKKKKSKLVSESLANENNQLVSGTTVPENKVKDGVSSDAKVINGAEAVKKSKSKMKKKDKSSSQGDATEQIGDPNETVLEKNLEASNNGKTHEEKKDSKKRKRPISEENGQHVADIKADEETKRRKIENLDESKGGEKSAKTEANLGGDSISNKENIVASGQVNGDQLQKTSKGQTNGDLENAGEKSSVQRSQKKQKGSGEQKPVKAAFQRVQVEKVEFADERLQDNSYWAKGGADSGYGAKAEEILGQVRGRDFRHEKTKKKRGTYRGGQIDLQSHSIKFNYSDDD
ncbi:nucleolar and coiled-body phosphoprotein 1 isoform X2 [Abrus precatorius]|uniref:Nucleolar and coiled-body phosphoprotein 1 isoform X2 n=1 Tax=Abrus precatorius TaxID=3816 RepID=A0A8B8JJ95_ABRPR|nr:nucleolar and coiled-body phosphoprotein 1 isoform X2 [Abrus precatorius]